MYMEENKKTQSTHSLSLKERKCMTITGVNEILSFDETCVSLELDELQLNVFGSNLKIDSFSNDSGQVGLSGMVDSIVYAGKSQASYRRGILKRLFSYEE